MAGARAAREQFVGRAQARGAGQNSSGTASYGVIGAPKETQETKDFVAPRQSGPRAVPARNGPCGFRAPWGSAPSGGFLVLASRLRASPI